MLSLDKFTFGLPVFIEGKHLVEVRLHQAVQLLVVLRNLRPEGLQAILAGVLILILLGLDLLNHPVRPFGR
ncbi:MAG: hypothetical protein ABSD28_01700 [Tepidisphaeraceae bacterium]